MKNAIILHGKPKKEEYYRPDRPNQSNSHWLPWLQAQLLIHNIKADTPEIPKPYDPTWDLWVKEVERFEIGSNTLIVGHSCGGGFWVRYLSEHKDLKAGKIILVAPWIDVEGEQKGDFFNFELDTNLADRTKNLIIFHSDDDKSSIQSSFKELCEKLKGVEAREFHKYGHFCYEDMKTDAFPELLEECLR